MAMMRIDRRLGYIAGIRDHKVCGVKSGASDAVRRCATEAANISEPM